VRSTVNKLGNSLNWDYHEKRRLFWWFRCIEHFRNSEERHTSVLILKIQNRREARHLTVNSSAPWYAQIRYEEAVKITTEPRVVKLGVAQLKPELSHCVL
jgi:hypothetical protein